MTWSAYMGTKLKTADTDKVSLQSRVGTSLYPEEITALCSPARCRAANEGQQPLDRCLVERLFEASTRFTWHS